MAREGLEELARVPIFTDLSQRQLRRVLRSTEEYTYSDGATFVKEGSRTHQLFVVLEGTARVLRRGRTVARLQPGDFFGDISLIDGLPRTATVEAEGTVRCLVLLRSDFERIITDAPQVASAVMRALARRIRETGRLPKELALP